MPISHNLGFPPLGVSRELKRATEGYWGGKVSLQDLLNTGAELRAWLEKGAPDRATASCGETMAARNGRSRSK